MSRVNKKLDAIYAREKRRKVLLISIPFLILLVFMMLLVPINTSRHNGYVESDPFISKISALNMTFKLVSLALGNAPRSGYTKNYSCRVVLESGLEIIASCHNEYKVGDEVRVVQSQNIIGVLFNTWSYSAFKPASLV